MRDALRSAPLFADLSDEDLDCLLEGAFEDSAAAGEVLFTEGDEGDRACLILDGAVEVLKVTGTREVLLAVRTAGEVIGEMALLDSAPRMASVRAKVDTRLLSIPKEQMDTLLANSATASRALFGVLLERWRETEARLRQSERMAQIGTLSAGLAHEMNNPAAAVTRAAGQMGDAMERLRDAASRATDAGLDADEGMAELAEQARGRPEPMSTVVRSDREAEIEDLLAANGVEDSWKLGPELAAAGISATDLEPVLDGAGASAAAIAELLAATADAASLVREIEEGSSRLSAIVGALKSYSHLDQAPVQEVDIHRGLEDTLLLLKGKLGDIEVRREYADGELVAEVHAAELNQVWTNLIDNAADALADVENPAITVRTSLDEGIVTVEVEDNGSGIPEDVVDRVFDAFFTTKPPGSGTGLGLDISYGIIADRHGGELTVESEPGRTVFRATFPARPA